MKLKAASSTGATARSAFTLIELLVVIAIIAILASLLLQTAGFVNEKAGRARAEAEIQAISNGLEAYKLENGTYPIQENGKTNNSTAVLVQALAAEPIANNRKPFEFPLKMLSNYRPSSPQPYDDLVRDPQCYLVDPFGNPYHYQKKQNENASDTQRSGATQFDLWSQGKKNRDDDENLWIKNW